jgi:anti-sigma regulatory factor (Ser/Thr protein kinase)
MEVSSSAVVLLPYTPSSVAVARRRLTADLASAGIFEPAVGDAALVVSELLSNSIRHAAPLPGSKIRVTWTLGEDALRVAVSDAGGGPLPRVTRPEPAAPGGRGLGIVETLSSCWGVVRDDGETTVWAELAAPHVDGAAPRPPGVPLTASAAGPPPPAAARPVPEPEHSAAEA